MNIWAGVIGTLGVVLAAWFAARATRAAAQATAEASRAAAQAAAEPAQRERDLEAFKAIRDDMQEEIRDLRTETTRLRAVVRAFAGYVGELTLQMRAGGIAPSTPPDLVDEYNRTGV
ncbi:MULTISPECIES: hypothetical protein [Streptomyces]|uniref:Uncharacterized protein n=2 Tax=Streptomyces rimosus subsp. rimosus TaxID=132474 RepID=L8EXV3_STRR1|nr:MULTISPECIES: hypothetical protein [Streptomyces]KOG70500.1 hypothetical protein ADK78_28310 [Kitasatospora aureofaciens]MYT47272.1 hypothetical protein [Streptomyces sp. SID5471]KEF04604.1 hypothetical protein DF17_22190 [Streptomyces rimosus]KEF19971.1 hypothetical protein DF18_14180 [Streptomyces rimosus]KOT31332.1 hypothetical protein ADK84_29825 [Streptomyces sp. NRRL WC-3701]